MATYITISNKDYINIDGDFLIPWEDKGKNWSESWLPDTIHYVVWNSMGPNEVQNKNASTGRMTGNIDLSSTSDSAGTTTVADLLTWGETRETEISLAVQQHDEAYMTHIGEGGDPNNWVKTWRDYDPNYS
jgi:hypothetical protein